AANVALNIASLGAKASLLGVVGRDEAGLSLKQRLQAVRIKTDFVVSKQVPTITKLRVISRHQQLIRMDFEEKIPDSDASLLTQKALSILKNFGAVVLSDYAKGSFTNPQIIIKAARAQKIPVFVDPKGTDFRLYRGATLLTPNLHEFEAVVGSCENEAIL